MCILSYFVSWYFVYFHELCFFMFWLLKLGNFPTFVINKVFLILVLISTLSDYGMECWSCAAILLWSSTWLIEWGLSGESWIISAEASWLGLAGALMMWYHSEPGPSVFVSECGCICLCVRIEMHAHILVQLHTRVCMCAVEQVCVHLRVCVCVCACFRLLPPTGWSFTFCTGRRDRRLPGCARSLGTVQLAMPGIH